jgi:SAM-dependent methyltransferase
MTNGGTSLPEVRRLLACLVASKPSGRIAEIGTAFGVGTRAIADAPHAEATLVSVEPDEERSAHARRSLGDSNVELVLGHWEEVLPERAPFDLIFFDGGISETGLQAAIELLAPGGILVKDDMTPWAPDRRGPGARGLAPGRACPERRDPHHPSHCRRHRHTSGLTVPSATTSGDPTPGIGLLDHPEEPPHQAVRGQTGVRELST